MFNIKSVNNLENSIFFYDINNINSIKNRLYGYMFYNNKLYINTSFDECNIKSLNYKDFECGSYIYIC